MIVLTSIWPKSQISCFFGSSLCLIKLKMLLFLMIKLKMSLFLMFCQKVKFHVFFCVSLCTVALKLPFLSFSLYFMFAFPYVSSVYVLQCCQVPHLSFLTQAMMCSSVAKFTVLCSLFPAQRLSLMFHRC